ncbi:ankyrin [Xylariomycetidae sp. FL2044]|nr:ankyrin [Xylariomycetidae sp. FL2044]
MAPSEKASPLSSPSPSPQDHAVRIPEKHPSGLDPSRLPFLTERGDTVSVRGILEASPSEQLKPFLQSSLDAACRRGHVEIVRLLVTAGAPVASTDRDGFTPLHRAAKKGSLDSVQYLLDHCEDRKSYVQACYQTPRIRVWPIPYRWEQNSALSCAAGEGHLDVVRYLVEAGADPLQELQNNGIAAHSACRGAKDYVQVVKYLMNVDRSQLEKRTSDEDDTCLHLAAQKDHIESAELLLSIGANHRARNAEGNTPWQVAHKAKSSNVMGALLRMEIYDRYQHEGIWRRLLEKMREASTYTYLFPGRKEYYWGGNKLILVGCVRAPISWFLNSLDQ